MDNGILENRENTGNKQNVENTGNKQNVENTEIIFIVPLGVSDMIFPWGIHSIKDFLAQSCQFLDMKIWDFREDNYFLEIQKKYAKLLKKLYLSLKPKQIEFFFTRSDNPNLFLGATAFTGDKYLEIAKCKKLFRKAYSKGLNDLKSEVDAHITECINKYIDVNREVTRIWAFSAYDATLFNALHVARIIKQVDPESTIIFGAEYFDFTVAQKIVKNISFIDGIVVGYGEEVIRKIVIEQQKNISIHNMKINGLVNKSFIESEEKPNPLMCVEVPEFFHKLATDPVVTYVKQPVDGIIRVFTQRGCSWGKCTFCDFSDKSNFFPVSTKHLIQGIHDEIEKSKAREITIQFDSDEVSADLLSEIIKCLERFKDRKVKFKLSLWLQVKSFKREMAEVLAKTDKNKISIRFMLNFESLNIDTLKKMRKGHLPIQAIEAARAIQDCGFTFDTNYFAFFPKENRAAAEQEVDILKRISHLLMKPKGSLDCLFYAANGHDTIHHEQEKYNIVVDSSPSNKWIREVYGIDVPFSFWLYSYKNKVSLDLDHLLTYTYKKYLDAHQLGILSYSLNKFVPRRFWSEYDWGDRWKVLFININTFFKTSAWSAIHYFMQIITNGRIFGRRFKLYMYLMSAAGRNKNGKGLAQSYFYITGNTLTKEYSSPEDKEKWSIELNATELKIIRYLYWRRSNTEVMDTFNSEFGEETKKIIEKHIKLGTIIQYKNILLSTVNDPEYWTNSDASNRSRL